MLHRVDHDLRQSVGDDRNHRNPVATRPQQCSLGRAPRSRSRRELDPLTSQRIRQVVDRGGLVSLPPLGGRSRCLALISPRHPHLPPGSGADGWCAPPQPYRSARVVRARRKDARISKISAFFLLAGAWPPAAGSTATGSRDGGHARRSRTSIASRIESRYEGVNSRVMVRHSF